MDDESSGRVRRDVAVRLAVTLIEPASLVLSIAVAAVHELDTETLTVEHDGRSIELHEIGGAIGMRLHETPDLPPGQVQVRYRASVAATDASIAAALPPSPEVSALERLTYLRPSRYCESDRLGPTARAEFGTLTGRALLTAVATWVRDRVMYVSGSSRPTDGAVATHLAREGVCRDFAHLVVAFLRACDVPARVVSVYAPGLDPMDFHAVAEAFVDGSWYVVDATGLAPRDSLVRIATGRDAADTAFLSVTGGAVNLDHVEVFAVAQPHLPLDDIERLVQLS